MPNAQTQTVSPPLTEQHLRMILKALATCTFLPSPADVAEAPSLIETLRSYQRHFPHEAR